MSLLIKKEKYASALTLLKAAVALPSFHFDESTKAKLLQMEIIAKLRKTIFSMKIITKL